MKELIKIQAELKAPKNQFNAFGKYKYRSCEDILEAVKPLLAKYECTLTLHDEVKEIGGLVFIEATASIQKDFSSKAIQKGIANEEEGITMLSLHLGEFLLKNVSRLKIACCECTQITKTDNEQIIEYERKIIEYEHHTIQLEE